MTAAPTVGPDAVETVRSLFRCRCEPAWTERGLHAPDCVEELGDCVIDILAEARAQFLAEVDAALRDEDAFGRWERAQDPVAFRFYVAQSDRQTLGAYLRDTLAPDRKGAP